MSVVREARVRATPRQVLEAVHAGLGRSDDAFYDVRSHGGRTLALAAYEQYFSRVGNRIALVVSADDLAGDGWTLVRVITTGSSRGLIFNFDLGAAGDYASEAMEIIDRLETSLEGGKKQPPLP
ncbi:MAG: DUF6054 family protein [Bacillota bacterium]|nr:DUF6054 family protein [Bacillota bacterium]